MPFGSMPPPPAAALPCAHPAGSEEKLLVLQARAALGLPLFHPLDDPRRSDRPEGSAEDLPPGVGFVRHSGRFRARVWDRALGAVVHLGVFDSPDLAEAAILRYRMAA